MFEENVQHAPSSIVGSNDFSTKNRFADSVDKLRFVALLYGGVKPPPLQRAQRLKFVAPCVGQSTVMRRESSNLELHLTQLLCIPGNCLIRASRSGSKCGKIDTKGTTYLSVVNTQTKSSLIKTILLAWGCHSTIVRIRPRFAESPDLSVLGDATLEVDGGKGVTVINPKPYWYVAA